MPSTKKLLVSFNTENKEPNSGDFLVPWTQDGICVFNGLKSGKESLYGMMVYIGTAVTENDLFAKLVDSGAKIESVDKTLANLRQYVEKAQSLRIGNVVCIRESEDNGFDLELVAKTPSGFIC